MRRRWIVPLVVAGLVAVEALAPAASAGPRLPWRLGQGPFGRAVVAAAPVPARFAFSRRDGNDTKGALDLRSLKLTRGKRKDSLVWSTIGRVANAQLNPKDGNFAVGFDTNDDKRYDYFQYLFFAAGRLRGLLVNIKTGRVVTRAVPTARVNARTFRQALLPAKIASPGTYRFALFSYAQAAPCSKKKPCIDGIPNRFPLLAVDHAKPTFTWGTTYAHSNTARADLSSPVSFTFKDDTFGTGVKGWTVQSRPAGGGAWTTVKTGRLLSPTVLVPGAQGASLDVRVIVTDKQRNRVISTLKRTSFPYDDTNPAFVQTSGTWDAGAPATAFLQTTSVGDQNAVMTISWTGGSSYCLLGGPAASGTPQATASLDTVAVGPPVDETTSTPARDEVLCGALAGGSGMAHVLVVTVTSTDAYVLDGLVVEP